ncbi:eRF1 domain 2 [Leptospira langatensis]|uniref:ERF1 domain 2 n=1 Tax=Leptospira langatensis TaxID=2484983 RepID=A0A5F1ZRB0_9LEPT|nr:eRF1 domain 2 [Leptospira langatensis]TGK02598.1 eRF1 domain 2 [Leptospira langatensis]TGL40201.1 eRF1 domain 2 [Leptospira langatensis]
MSHCILWIDSSTAKRITFDKTSSESHVISHKTKPEKHDTHKDRIGQIKAEDLKHFFEDVASELSDHQDLLIVGPGLCKTLFRRHLEQHHPNLAKLVLTEIGVNHPSDAEILNIGRTYHKQHPHNI